MMKHNFQSVNFPLVLCLFICGLVLSCSSGIEVDNVKTDLEKIGLQGHIKRLVESEHMCEATAGEIRRTNLLRRSVSEYNESGFLLAKEVHDSTGKTISKETYKYNEENKLVDLHDFKVFPSGINEIVKSYEYDDAGNETQCIEYNADGSISTTSTKIYDNNRLVEQSTYFGGGSLMVKSTFKYDSDGNLIESLYFDSEGNLEYKDISEYDSHGNDTATYRYDSEGKLTLKFISEYSSQNKLLRKTSSDPDNSIRSEMTNIYDDYGNIVENRLLDKVNKIDRKELTVYNTEGNVIDRTVYSDGKFWSSFKYSDSDPAGNFLRLIITDSEGSTVTEREIGYYQ